MSTTRFLMTGAVIIVALYDLCVVVFTGNIDASVSKWFASFATYPAIVFGVGYVCGHFFGWMTPTIPAGKAVELLKLAKEIEETPLVYPRERWATRIKEIAGS